MYKLAVLLTFLLSSCIAPSIIDYDAGLFPEGDAKVINEHVCDPETVDSDFFNCGICGYRCPPTDSDRCSEGNCLCGFNVLCNDISDCRMGACISVDPNGIVCEFDSECTVNEACIEDRCSFVSCAPEVCDGTDNDCDGEIDNFGPTPLAEYCYSGPDINNIILPCSKGIRTCIGGEWTECVGEIVPTDEVGVAACDMIDNDCDGCVDGIMTDEGVCISEEPQYFDVLFEIDNSGSMSIRIEIVRQSVHLFSRRLSGSPAFHWGIVLIPGPVDGTPFLYQDLTTFDIFEASLASLVRNSGGSEPQYDAIYEAVTGEMGVSWREGSVRIIPMFTDEHGQSTRSRRMLGIDINETMMCDSMINGEVFIPVVVPMYQSFFDDCAYRILNLPTAGSAGSGSICREDLECASGETCEDGRCVTAIVVETADELSAVIAEPCGGGL